MVYFQIAWLPTIPREQLQHRATKETLVDELRGKDPDQVVWRKGGRAVYATTTLLQMQVRKCLNTHLYKTDTLCCSQPFFSHLTVTNTLYTPYITPLKDGQWT